MPYTIEDYHRECALRTLPYLTARERLEGLAPKERLEGLGPKERLEGLGPKERLEGLAPSDLLDALNAEERKKLWDLMSKRPPADDEARG